MSLENLFLRLLQFAELLLQDWRIDGSDVSLDTLLAQGSEGQVWKGKVAKLPETVAIKLSHCTDEGDPWDEREIAFMYDLLLSI